MPIDLHVHSLYSDGTHPPARLVDAAVAVGLSAMALTDHDLFDGIPEAEAAAAGRLELVPGIELSVAWGDRKMHLLGLWVGPGSPLDENLSEVRMFRSMRNVAMIEALAAMGYPITVDEVATRAEKGVIGRPHMADVLVEKGLFSTNAEAFEALLGEGGPAYRDRERWSVGRAVELIAGSGGVAVAAHPHTVADDADGFRSAFAAFAEAGIVGVECWYGEYPPAQRVAMAAMAERHGLVPSGGSDHHGGRRKPGLEVGVGRGDLFVPDEVLDRLKERRPAT